MSKRILTIDNSKTIRDMLMLTLAEAGFEVLQAVDGQDGLDVLDKEQVDVVITDINMPRMDGYEVIRHLRSNSAHKSMPILVLTTESEAEKKNLARAAGATGWMVKPFDPERLIATINKVAPVSALIFEERRRWRAWINSRVRFSTNAARRCSRSNWAFPICAKARRRTTPSMRCSAPSIR